MSAECSTTRLGDLARLLGLISLAAARAAPRGCARRRPCRAPSSGWLSVLTKSWRRSATRQPSALVRPGRAGTSTFGRPSSRASADGVQRPGAAEGEQREVARVVAARQRHHADRAGHVGVGEPEHGRGRAAGVEPERRGRSASAKIAAHAPRRRPARRPPAAPPGQPAEHQIGVGDGRLVPPRP